MPDLDGTLLLSGIVGSTAYGLAGPGSDVDRLGVYAAPTTAFHGLRPPMGKDASRVTTDPDATYHEAGKYASLCLAGNPTVMELLWLPDDLYELRTTLGDDLIGIRSAFLSAKKVRDAYLGYAVQQFRRLANRGDGSFGADLRKRTAKHARHLARLVHQGLTLYQTGRLTVRLDDPAWYRAFGDSVAEGDIGAARHLIESAQTRFDAARTPLPDHPDHDTVDRWLQAVRAAHYRPEPEQPAPGRAAVTAARYWVSCIPLDHPSASSFNVIVARCGDGRWEVRRGDDYPLLGADGTWSWGYRPPFGDREPTTDEEWDTYHRGYDEWRDRHCHDEATALDLARRAAPAINVMGRYTVADAWADYTKGTDDA